MGRIKQKVKHMVSVLIHGEPKPVYAQISYLQPNGVLKGRKIIVTGGGRGLGYSMAKKFVAEGASVLISGRNEETLKKTASEIGCKYVVFDVSNPDNFDSFIAKADDMLGGADTLVNNAGISLHEPTFFDVTVDTFDRQINTNFRGPYFLSQSFISLLKKKRRKGTILFVSSETGETVDCRPYGFTKAAINSMVKGLANLFAKDGIRINAIAPGITSSDMTGFKKEGDITCTGNITGRAYMPEEMAETACFLISDAAGCISGQVVVCNNARTVNPRWR